MRPLGHLLRVHLISLIFPRIVELRFTAVAGYDSEGTWRRRNLLEVRSPGYEFRVAYTRTDSLRQRYALNRVLCSWRHDGSKTSPR